MRNLIPLCVFAPSRGVFVEDVRRDYKNILAIDAHAEILDVALQTVDGRFRATADTGNRHSELLVGMVDGLFKTAGLKPTDLEAAICPYGPGTFTGVMIGDAAVKGIALGLGCDKFSLSTLDVAAFACASDLSPQGQASSHDLSPQGLSAQGQVSYIIPALDARRGRFYAAVYKVARGNDAAQPTIQPVTEAMDAEASEIMSVITECTEDAGAPAPVYITGFGGDVLYNALYTKLPVGRLRVDTGGRRGYSFDLLNFFLKDCTIEKGWREPLYVRKPV
jgi:tRNA threonylcarbamoyl adenosine modification protein YeaZ